MKNVPPLYCFLKTIFAFTDMMSFLDNDARNIYFRGVVLHQRFFFSTRSIPFLGIIYILEIHLDQLTGFVLRLKIIYIELQNTSVTFYCLLRINLVPLGNRKLLTVWASLSSALFFRGELEDVFPPHTA